MSSKRKPRKSAGRRSTEPKSSPDSERNKPKAIRAGTDLSVKLSTGIGIVALMVLAVFVNIIVARNYERWDFTRGGLYTLSPATVETLKGLQEPVEVYVLLSTEEPLRTSIDHLLEAYGAVSERLNVRYVDPDRNPAEFLAIQKRFRLETGRSEDGRIVTDAAVILALGDRHYFITPSDLVTVEDPEDLRTRPRLEEAITGGIRNVLGGDRPKICFTTGHGEFALDLGGDSGMAELRERLYKNNYEIAAIPSFRDDPHQSDALDDCRLVVLGGPTEAVPPQDVARLKKFIEGGGNALLVVGPVASDQGAGFMDLGVGDLMALAGVDLKRDLVFEQDPTRRASQGAGEQFMPKLQPHAINDAHIQVADDGVPVVMVIASSLEERQEDTNIKVTPLLVTTESAFSLADIRPYADNPSQAPRPGPSDRKGELVVATASERAKAATDDKPSTIEQAHGRIVVITSIGVLVGSNWNKPDLRGTSLFVENVITWLASHRVFLGIPPKEGVVGGLRLTEASVSSITLYVLLLLPGLNVMIGVLVHLRRRRERRPRAAATTSADDDEQTDEDDETDKDDSDPDEEDEEQNA